MRSTRTRSPRSHSTATRRRPKASRRKASNTPSRSAQWPYDLAKAKQLMKEAGYPNGFETELWSAYNHSTAQKVTQFLQQQLQQIGIKHQDHAARGRVSASRKSRAGRIRRPRRCASTTSAGRRRPAKPTGRCGRCSTASRGRRGCSTPRTTRTRRSTPTSRARSSRPTARKKRSSTRTRRKRSGRMRPGRRWSSKSCCRRTTRSSPGVYVMPDASFNFTEVDLKP